MNGYPTSNVVRVYAFCDACNAGHHGSPVAGDDGIDRCSCCNRPVRANS